MSIFITNNTNKLKGEINSSVIKRAKNPNSIDNCEEAFKLKQDSNIVVQYCISGLELKRLDRLDKQGTAMQNFAISGKYDYFSKK